MAGRQSIVEVELPILAHVFAEVQKKLVIRQGFLWPMGMTTAPLRIPTNGKDARPIREIPPEETAIAVQECVNSAVGTEGEDLIRKVCKLFGLKTTDDNSIVIDGVIDQLVSNQMLISKNGKIPRGKVFSSTGVL